VNGNDKGTASVRDRNNTCPASEELVDFQADTAALMNIHEIICNYANNRDVTQNGSPNYVLAAISLSLSLIHAR